MTATANGAAADGDTAADNENETETETDAETVDEIEQLDDGDQVDDEDAGLADEDGAEHDEDGAEHDEDGAEHDEDDRDDEESGGDVIEADAARAEVVPPSPPTAPAVDLAEPTDEWTTRQLGSVLTRALAVCLALAVLGFGAGFLRGGSHVARAEFVYTLDQSVPDSFLREDRRLLTQVATFTSDAVLLPVAQQFDLDVDRLRASIDIETVALSEVLRLEVTDADAGRALALNRAILDQYLLVITEAAPAGDSRELNQQREAVVAELAAVDEQLLAIEQTAELDAALLVRQDSIQRRIDLGRDRIAGLQSVLDDTLTGQLGATQGAVVAAELDDAEAELIALEAELTEVVGERASLATSSTARTAIDREVERLESQLATIDTELSQRELGPLVASPIRELSEPIVVERSAVVAGLQGAAAGMLLAVPVAAWVAYRTRRRQLWAG